MDDLRDTAWDTADKLVDAGCMCRAECIDKHTNAIASAIRAAVEAERRKIAERLDACFEPTAPATPIISELVATALTIIQEAAAIRRRTGNGRP